MADIQEALQRGDVFKRDSLAGQVFIDERVAEFVRERIGQESRQAMKSLLRQSRKTEPPFAF
jgi:hypothetical protein